MKRAFLFILLIIITLASFCQTNLKATFIQDETFVSTQFWPQNTIVYVVSDNQWRLITGAGGWTSGTAFSTTTNIHADPPDMSGTLPMVLALITDAGSGQIITTDERAKLTGIEIGAEVNVQSDWNAVSGDALILNKPTIPDQEAIEDIVGTMVTGNTQTGITVTYDDATGKINFVVTSMLVSPEITAFSITGEPTTVAPGTTITGSKDFTYTITDPANVSGNLTLTQDAVNLATDIDPNTSTRTLTINDVTLTNAGDNTVFELSGTGINSETFNRTFTITAVGQDEFLYIGLSQDSNPVNLSLTSPTKSIEIIGPGQSGSFSVGPTSLNDFIIILAPNDHDLTFLANTHFPASNIISTYTRTASVRTINGQVYNAYVFGPTNAGFTQTYNYTLN